MRWLKMEGDVNEPEYATRGSAGMDIEAFLPDGEPIVLYSGQRKLIPTGLKIRLPANSELQIRPRSGLAYKHGVTVLNSPGTIDSDYEGEVKVLLINHGDRPFTINSGDRIAQGVYAFCSQASQYVKESVERGDGGFGSTDYS